MRIAGGLVAGLSRAMRCAVYLRGGFRCAYCGVKLAIGACLGNPHAATIDHVVPVDKGGLTVPANLVPACAACNTRKGSKTLLRWRGSARKPVQCRRAVDLVRGRALARFLYPRRGNVAGERPAELWGFSVNVRDSAGKRVLCRDGRGAGTAGQSPWSGREVSA